MRKADYVVERAIHGENLEEHIIGLITGQYGVALEKAKIAFENCMLHDFAVILPVSKNYPSGVMISTDLYRQIVVIG